MCSSSLPQNIRFRCVQVLCPGISIWDVFNFSVPEFPFEMCSSSLPRNFRFRCVQVLCSGISIWDVFNFSVPAFPFQMCSSSLPRNFRLWCVQVLYPGISVSDVFNFSVPEFLFQMCSSSLSRHFRFRYVQLLVPRNFSSRCVQVLCPLISALDVFKFSAPEFSFQMCSSSRVPRWRRQKPSNTRATPIQKTANISTCVSMARCPDAMVARWDKCSMTAAKRATGPGMCPNGEYNSRHVAV
jgi:hypothetical protein